MRILLLLLGASFCLGFSDDLEEFDRMMSEPRDRSGWVDPMDMGLEESGFRGACAGAEICGNELRVCKELLQKLAEERNSSTTTATPTVNPTTSPRPVAVTAATDVFLRRWVSYLVSRLGLAGHTAAHLRLEVQLSPHQVDLLLNYVAARPVVPVRAVDVSDILSTMVRGVEGYQSSPVLQTMKEHLSSVRDPLISVTLILGLLYIGVVMARRLPPSRVLLVVLLCCLCWHWLHLYKTTWAAKHSTLLQSGEVPPECRPKEMTWLQTLSSAGRSVFSSVDRCEEYHKAIMVDPIYEVNPLTALVDLLTKLLLHPLSSLGTEVGNMFSGLLGAVPLFWKVPVLLVFVLLIMFCLILLAGYRLRLPLWLGELSPAQPSSSASLTAELEELRKLLSEGRKASSALQDLRHQQPLGAGDGRALYRGAAVEELVDTVDHGEEDSGASRKLSLEFKTMTLEDRLQTSSLPGTPRKTLPPSTPVRGLGTLGQASEPARPTTPLRGLETLSYGAGAAPLPSTPLRGLSRGVVALTPVKNRVMGQPEVLRPVDLTREEEVLDLRKTEEQEGERDLRSEEEVVDLRKREDREVQFLRKEEVLALRKEDSDDDLLNIEEELREPAVLMTPKKELVVIGNPASPSTTSFDWMVEERKEDKQVQQVLVVEEKEEDEKVQEVMASAGRQGAEFLDKVEDIFHKEESL